MADDSGSVRMAIGTAVGGASIALLAGASCWLGMKAYRDGRFSRGWRWVRIWALGGVTTLEQTLAYDCAMCGHSLDQREEVRTLSCGHVFHLRKGPKCGSNIDDWLRENRMRCPACCKPVHPVLPWKAPPTSAPPPAPVPLPTQSEPSSSTSDLEAQEPRRMELEQGPPRRLALDQGRPRYPPSMWFQTRYSLGRRSSKDASSSLDGTVLERLLEPVWITSSRGSSRILSSFLFLHS